MSLLLHDLLREAAAAAPDQEAVRCAGRSLTYGQLESGSNALASRLVDAGVHRGDRVGIYLTKSVEMVVAVYGTLKAGAAYVPLDPNAPPTRIATVATDCTITALVSTSTRAKSLGDVLAGLDLRLIVLVEHPDEPEGEGILLPGAADVTITWADATSDLGAKATRDRTDG